jgi:hypothetical protein
VEAGGGVSGAGVACCSVALSSNVVVQDASSASAPVYDDAGNLIDGSTGGTGGVTTSTANNISGTGVTVPDKGTGTYTITGLQNYALYNVAVGAVDAFGNVGPLSSLACDYPQPVVDFWQQYRRDGGQAGGGFCTLEAAGMPVGPSLFLVGVAAAGVAFVRRRRGRP